MKRATLYFLLYGFVFATGAAGLIYQVVWQKYVSRLLGADTVATAIILATFLGGLSLGYYLCGKLSVRSNHPFIMYALLEALIGIWCLAFPWIFEGVTALSRSWSFAPPVLILVQGVFCAALLMLLPTICMGGTLPFLTRGITRNIGEATRVHATIYSTNTAGAFLGTLLTGFYLIPTFGLPVTITRAAFLNLAAAAFFVLFSRLVPPIETSRATEQPAQEIAPQEGLARSPAWRAYILYGIAFLSGFYVMTLENVLIRIINLSLGSSSYSFSLIVAVFILAIAVGSYVVGRLPRIPRSLLFFNQLVITLTLLGIYLSLDSWPYWAHVIRIGLKSNVVGFWQYYVLVLFALIAVLLIPVGCMGATIPIVFHEVKRDLASVGKASGMLFSWNTIGNLTGSLIGGIVLYYVLNNARVYLISVLLAAGSTYLAGWYSSKNYVLPATFLPLVMVALTVFAPFYDRNHFIMGTFRERSPLSYSLEGADAFFEKFNEDRTVRFYRDGPTCTTVVLETPKRRSFEQQPLAIIINGKSDSNTIGDIYTLKLSAHLPALLAESRQHILVIGLGTGVTAGELTLYEDVEQIDVAEISPSVIEALPYFDEFTYSVHTDPRVQIYPGDAFRVLSRSDKKWDIIISEPSNPWVTGVDLLFTQEFYRLAKEHLTEDGILLQWAQIYASSQEMVGMIFNTVRQEFPQSRVFIPNWGDLFIIASKKPLTLEHVQRAEALLRQNQHVQTSLNMINMPTLDTMLIREIWTPSYLAKYFSNYGIQSMDNPQLHYIAGKSFFIGATLAPHLLLHATSVPYLEEYLLPQKYPDWTNFPFSQDAFSLLLYSTKSKVDGSLLPMTEALELKAYLGNPEVYRLREALQQQFRVELLPFIMQPTVEDQEWERIGLGEASIRQRAEILLEHVAQFRNWIVPYRIDGLKALLRHGITAGADAHERTWCALQLAWLHLREGADKRRVQEILVQAFQENEGELLLQGKDQALLERVLKLLEESEEGLSGL
ncbi:hypothetical protein GF339_02480 [candidate division KSB3 bacterium]|uniref:PABS domain-containing protein n=1 Tax=candidate division KSB3 bacterium TaxID=2044937 RepID=A0A9D5JSI3_9BACT|nr:hypothetical protein [candidate division KSB3 bacterium]MBD3323420.1 hypothetical protein [candidate division KSB3 bacterium]